MEISYCHIANAKIANILHKTKKKEEKVSKEVIVVIDESESGEVEKWSGFLNFYAYVRTQVRGNFYFLTTLLHFST